MSSISLGGISNIQQSTTLLSSKPQISTDNVMVNVTAVRNEPSVWVEVKEAGISMIPFYGTYREFQKGNIGWGIFAAVTDVATLVGVGLAAKGVACCIRGGAASAKIARAGLAASRVAEEADILAQVRKGDYFRASIISLPSLL